MQDKEEKWRAADSSGYILVFNQYKKSDCIFIAFSVWEQIYSGLKVEENNCLNNLYYDHKNNNN